MDFSFSTRILLTLCFGVAYRFLVARGLPPGAAAAFATVFLFASVVPLYVVWLTPELFNFSLMFYAFFLCASQARVPGGGCDRSREHDAV